MTDVLPVSPSSSPPAPVRGRPPSAFFALYRLFLRFQVTRTRLLCLGGLSAAGIVVGWSLGQPRVYNHLLAGTDFANVFGLAILVPLVCLVFSSSIFGDLADDSTLVYLWLRPLPRHRIVLAGALSALTVSLPIAVPPLVLATYLTKGGPKLVAATTTAAIVLTFAYVGIFVALGLRVKRPLVWGLLYIFIWEGFVAQGSISAAKFAMRAYGSSILHEATNVKVVTATFDQTSSIGVPLGVCVLALVYATWRLRRQDVAWSAPAVFRAHPHDREILRLALPALGALIAEPLYLLADTAVVGHLGTDALAGMAVATTLLLTGYSIFIFLAYGTTAAVARLLGAGDEREAAHQAVQGLWLAGAIGLVLAVVVGAAAVPLVSLMGATGVVADNAVLYLRISLLGVPALLVTLAGTGYLRGLQDTRTPLVVAVVSSVANLVLEVVLIYGFGLGLAASAATTVVVQIVVGVVYVAVVARAVRRHQVPRGPRWRSLRDLGRVRGWDLFVRTAALRGSLTLATAVAARFGPVALAAYQIAFQIWNVLALALDAIAIAGQAMIGRFLGAVDVAQARSAGGRMMTWGVVAGVVMAVFVAALRTVIPSVFSSDPAVVATAATILLWVALVQPVNGLVFVLDGLLIGAGDLGFLAWAMLGAFAVFVPAALAVMVTEAGLGWLWAALTLLMLARLVALYGRWRQGGWAVTGATRSPAP